MLAEMPVVRLWNGGLYPRKTKTPGNPVKKQHLDPNGKDINKISRILELDKEGFRDETSETLDSGTSMGVV